MELRNSSMKIKNNDVKSVMDKYNMLFLGSKFNTIYSIELHHYINTKLNFNISMDELNSLIPDVCKILNMNFEELIAIEDIGKPNPSINFRIILWQ